MKQATRISCVVKAIRVYPLSKHAPINPRKLDQLKIMKVVQDLPGRMNAMGIETNTRFADRNRKVQIASRGEDTGEFSRSFLCALGIQWIPITPQADVFCHV